MKDALVLIDFVNDIINEKGKVAKFGTPTHVIQQNAIANTKKVLEDARTKGTKVLFVRVGFSEGHPELADIKAPFYQAHKANNWLVLGTWGTEIHEDLKPLANEVVLTKSRINPFTNPEFENELKGIDRIVLTGVSTNLAVEETVRTAAAKGFDVLVLEDCCASNNQELHEFSVRNILPKFCTIMKSTDYLSK